MLSGWELQPECDGSAKKRRLDGVRRLQEDLTGCGMGGLAG